MYSNLSKLEKLFVLLFWRKLWTRADLGWVVKLFRIGAPEGAFFFFASGSAKGKERWNHGSIVIVLLKLKEIKYQKVIQFNFFLHNICYLGPQLCFITEHKTTVLLHPWLILTSLEQTVGCLFYHWFVIIMYSSFNRLANTSCNVNLPCWEPSPSLALECIKCLYFLLYVVRSCTNLSVELDKLC